MGRGGEVSANASENNMRNYVNAFHVILCLEFYFRTWKCNQTLSKIDENYAFFRQYVKYASYTGLSNDSGINTDMASASSTSRGFGETDQGLPCGGW